MPDITRTELPAPCARTWWQWFRGSIQFRVSLVMLLIAALFILDAWRIRQGAWAVLFVGGGISASDSNSARRRHTLDEYLPGFARQTWQLSAASEWLQEDRRIFGVNLAQSSVDHRWLPHLAPMTALAVLSLNSRQLGDRIDSLSRLSQLREIRVINPRTETAMQHLLNLPGLERLVLVNPASTIGGFAALGRHPSLRHLDLEAMDVDSRGWSVVLNQCAGWSNLQTISIRSLHPVTAGLKSLSNCDSLKTLELSAPIDQADFVALSRIMSLTTLIVNTSNPEAGDWLMLKSLGNLRSVKIFSRGGPPLPLEKLRKLLPDCEIEGGP